MNKGWQGRLTWTSRLAGNKLDSIYFLDYTPLPKIFKYWIISFSQISFISCQNKLLFIILDIKRCTFIFFYIFLYLKIAIYERNTQNTKNIRKSKTVQYFCN